MANKKTVAVIFGSQSSEHEVSRISAATIINNINPDKYYIIPIGITKQGKWLIYNGPVDNIKNGEWEKFGTPAIISPDTTHKAILKIVGDKIKTIPIDVIFPVLHGAFGEDGTIQGLFEMAQIPYVGCGVLASAVSMDKLYTKIIVNSIGDIAQAEYVKVYSYELEKINPVVKKIEKNLGYPCFIKPSNAGSSVGITKAHNADELKEGLKKAAGYDRKILVEKAITGREVECAVLGNENKIEASTVGEVLAAAEFYDYDAKYNNDNSKTVIPADLPEKIVEEIQDKAKRIFMALDGAGLSRVDFFVENETNRVIFNEINTLPGFTSISMYPMLWEQEGVNKTELIDKLIELAFNKN